MPPKKKAPITVVNEESLILPEPPSTLPIVDTHSHLSMTFNLYQSTYKEGKYTDIFEFAKAIYGGRNMEAIVDVWCEAPIKPMWKTLADSALTPEDRLRNWDNIDYWFAIGVHPHDAKNYTDEVEKELCHDAPRCVSWGEIGLDYHYDNSPRPVQREVFARQLRNAVSLGKPLTIHTREAEEDTERILKEIVPKDHRIHIHCFTDSPEFAKRLLDYYPNLYIGITGVITYSTNSNTRAVISGMVGNPGPETDLIPASDSEHHITHPKESPESGEPAESAASLEGCLQVETTLLDDRSLRIVLETDAPFMIPTNLGRSLGLGSRRKLPLSHSAMIPWIAEFTANVATGGWTADNVMEVARANARRVYGV